jgi:hypothetical protein
LLRVCNLPSSPISITKFMSLVCGSCFVLIDPVWSLRVWQLLLHTTTWKVWSLWLLM